MSSSESDPDQLVGEALGGRYVVVRRIGQGGMGAVYEATDRRFERRVAVKVLFDLDDKSIARFAQEAAAAAKIAHPNAVTILDHGVARPSGSEVEVPFIVMEYLDGTSLRARLLERGPLPEREAVAIARALLRALSAAHALGIVHRDVKPGNVMLLRDDEVKLVDFGIAKIETSSVATTTGTFVGTAGYAAPEQIMALTVDACTDVWAVGLCLYQMIAGRWPWHATDPNDALVEILARSAPALRSRAPNVDARLDAIVNRALARKPEDRFASASEMEHALADLDQPTRAAREKPLPPPRRSTLARVSVIAVAVFALGGGAAGALAFVQRGKEPAPSASRGASQAAPALSASADPVASLSAMTTTELPLARSAPLPPPLRPSVAHSSHPIAPSSASTGPAQRVRRIVLSMGATTESYTTNAERAALDAAIPRFEACLAKDEVLSPTQFILRVSPESDAVSLSYSAPHRVPADVMSCMHTVASSLRFGSQGGRRSFTLTTAP